MCNCLEGVPVSVEAHLTFPEINKIVTQLVQDWEWEGRELGRVEIRQEGTSICVCAYGKPLVKVFSINTKGDA